MKKVMILLGVIYTLTLAVSAQQSPTTQSLNDPPRLSSALELTRPTDYREWIFLASGLGMTYEPAGAAPNRPQNFTNVFVNPSAYRAFMQTGAWPDKTALVLEIRGSETEGSINKGGRFQTQQVRAIEMHVKDSRLPGGWGFFNFREGVTSAKPLEGDQVKRCNDCHNEHAALDTTFVQFYPTLIDVATQKGTLR